MLKATERAAIDRLWSRKLEQDAQGLPKERRHRNLEPVSAEFLHALATGCRARRMLEVGGSSGISTIALAAAARETGGRLLSIEVVASRQAEARQTLRELQLEAQVELVLADAASVLPGQDGLELVLLDCEKEDYVSFFDMLRLAPGAVVVADNVLSHGLWDYVRHVRARAGAESVTLAIGKGLELTRCR